MRSEKALTAAVLVVDPIIKKAMCDCVQALTGAVSGAKEGTVHADGVAGIAVVLTEMMIKVALMLRLTPEELKATLTSSIDDAVRVGVWRRGTEAVAAEPGFNVRLRKEDVS
jgi:hypothetical protein